jgi:RNA polymerase sigma-70 factor (ECF subfamily)
MLGSAFEADDAAQETLIRAWRHIDGFEGRSSLRSWLYRIATNVCIDMIRRRKVTADIDPEVAEAAGHVVGAAAPASPDVAASVVAGPSRTAGPGAGAGDPADVAVARDDLRHALGALRLLPQRQRTVLILGDVLRWTSEEIAELLDTSVASVTSARQRARATLRARAASGEVADGSPCRDPLLARVATAFEQSDVDRLVSLVRPA